MIKYDLNINL